jgi:hypothetical protein
MTNSPCLYFRGLLAALSVASLSATAVEPTASTVVLVNTGSTAAHAKLNFHEVDGKVASTLERDIPPLGIALLPVLLAGFDGAAQVFSDQPVRALVLNAGSGNKVRDSYEGTAPTTAASFPLLRVPGGDGRNTQMSVHNTDAAAAAEVKLRYLDESGSEVDSRTATLPPLGSFNFDADGVGGTGAIAGALESSVPVVAAEQIIESGDGISLPAIAEQDECKRCIVGFAKIGRKTKSPQWTEIHIQNRGTATAKVKLAYYDAKGRAKSAMTRDIPAQGFARFDTRAVGATGNDFVGYAIVSQDSAEQPLAVQWRVQDRRGLHRIGFNATDEAEGSSLWACPNAPRRKMGNAPVATHLVAVNPGQSVVTAKVALYDPTTGARLVEKTYVLRGKGQINIDLKADKFRKAGIGFAGLAMIRALNGQSLFVSAYNEYKNGGSSGYTCLPQD